MLFSKLVARKKIGHFSQVIEFQGHWPLKAIFPWNSGVWGGDSGAGSCSWHKSCSKWKRIDLSKLQRPRHRLGFHHPGRRWAGTVGLVDVPEKGISSEEG
jgi:hypothetical protein